MTTRNRFRQLAIAACPWLLLATEPIWAESPTLSDPVANHDEGNLLRSVVRDQSNSSGSTRDLSIVTEAPQDADLSPRVAELPRSMELKPVIQGTAPELSPDAGGLNPKVEVIRERYPNRKVRIEREVTQDALGNYLNHGSWKMWDERGNLMAEGQNAEGLRQGVWNRWHARADSPLFAQYPYSQFTPPFVSQAEFKDGQLSGQWTIYDAKQRKISQWSFAAGQRDGLSLWWHANGKKLREITYKNGAIDGEAFEFNDAGVVSSRANFQSGRKLALRVEKHADGGIKTQGMYLHAPMVVKSPDDWWNAIPAVFTHVGKDERHGDWVTLYPNGQEQLKGRYQNDLENGTFTWWYANGQKSAEGLYEHGRQQGNWVWWHKNGQKSTEGNYKNGDQIGRWTVWNDMGRVTQASEHAGDTNSTAEGEEAPLPDSEPSLIPAPNQITGGAPAARQTEQNTARAPRFLEPVGR